MTNYWGLGAVWWKYHYLTCFSAICVAKDGDRILGKRASDLTQYGHSYLLVLWLLRYHVEILMAKHFCIIFKFKDYETDAVME